MSERRSAVGLFFLALALFLTSYVGAFRSNDERVLFSSIDSFVKRGDFTANQMYWDYTNVGMLTTSGEMVPNYEPGQIILAIPLYLWGRALDATVQGVLLWGVLVSAASVTLLYLMVLELGYGRRAALLGALVYGFGTNVWAYSKSFYRDPLATLALLVVFYALLRLRPPAPRRAIWAIIAGSALGVALVTKQVSVAAIPSVLLLVTVYERRRSDGWGARLTMLAAAGIPLALILGAAQLYYRALLADVEVFARSVVDFTTNPQLSSSETTRMVRAALGLTISPFRGIFWFAPALLLALPGSLRFLRRHRWEGLAFGGVVAANLLGYSRFLFWAEGAGYGSRYMLAVLPYLVLLAAPVWAWLVEPRARAGRGRLAAALAWGLIALSVLFQLVGVSVHMGAYEVRYLLEQAPRWGGIGETIDATYLNPRSSALLGNPALLLGGDEVLDTAWFQRRAEGGSALVPRGLALTLAYLALALAAFARLWRRPTRGIVLGMAALTPIVLSLLLHTYRQGDYRFDPYGVDEFLRPLVDTLDVPCHALEGEPRHCDGVLVMPDPLLTDYLLTSLDAPLPWYAIDNPPAEIDEQLLAQLVRRYPTLYLLRDRSGQADDDQGRRGVERLVATLAYRVDETRAAEWARLIEYSAAGRPVEHIERVRPLGELALVSTTLRLQNEHALPPRAALPPEEPAEPLDDGLVVATVGDVLQIALTWEATGAPEADYTLFLQLLDGAGQVALQRDRQPQDGLARFGALPAGETLEDRLAIPLDLPPGRYTLITGLYRADAGGLPRLVGPEGDALRLAEIEVR